MTVSSYLASKRKTVKDISLKSKVVRLAVLIKFMGREIALPGFRSEYTGDSKLPVNGSVTKVYSVVTNPRDRVILDLARFAGLRRKEIALMEWRDVDLEVRTIFVRHTKGYRLRVVPFGERLWISLSSYDYKYGGRLFELQPNGVSQVIKRLSESGWSEAPHSSASSPVCDRAVAARSVDPCRSRAPRSPLGQRDAEVLRRHR